MSFKSQEPHMDRYLHMVRSSLLSYRFLDFEPAVDRFSTVS